jgi:hypothetical protein
MFNLELPGPSPTGGRTTGLRLLLFVHPSLDGSTRLLFPFSLSGFQRRPDAHGLSRLLTCHFLPITATSIAAEDQITTVSKNRKHFLALR